MKKKLFITVSLLLTCCILGFGGWKGYQYWKMQQLIAAHQKAWEEDCKYWLEIVAEVNVPALTGGYYRDYMNTSNCLINATHKHLSEEQYELYIKLVESIKKTADAVLYYKSEGKYCSVMEYSFLIIVQSFIHNKITNDKQYEVKNPYKIGCEFEKEILETPICLVREILKLCNIETRRHVQAYLTNTTKAMYNFLQTVTNDQQTLQQWIKEYYNLMQLFTEMVKADDILMNPINSYQFMQDWYLLEKMNGIEPMEVSEVPKPYPLPFP